MFNVVYCPEFAVLLLSNSPFIGNERRSVVKDINISLYSQKPNRAPTIEMNGRCAINKGGAAKIQIINLPLLHFFFCTCN